MFLEEKIELLKLKFSSADFSVPFTNGSAILKSIEKKFIVTKNLNTDLNNLRQYFNNWAGNIKNKVEIKSIDLTNHPEWLYKLDANKNYWLIITQPNLPAAKHLVYDCKPPALIVLLSFTQGDFFIVDKKYNWLSYFKVDKQNKFASIYKSGEKTTPFEL